MAASYSFRKALNGFHREDVVHHLEYINAKHNNQLNLLKAELDVKEKEVQRLRALEGVQEQLAELQAYCAKLEQEKQGYEDRIAQLQSDLEQEQARQIAIVNRTEEELEAYRRAERLERQAQQRADQLFSQANSILATAGQGVNNSAQRIDEIAQQFLQQLEALKQEVNAGKDVLNDAADALGALRSE